MGLDYGAKTIGVAVTDPSGLIAQPLRTIFREREGKLRRSLQEIAALVSELSVERIVIGLPLNMDETEGERAEKAREFAALLAKRVLVPIEWVDERLTTIAAREILDESGVPREEQKRMIDQVAAQLILETWKSRKASFRRRQQADFTGRRRGRMENGRIRLRSEDGELELEVLEETVLQGRHYILAADTEGEEDGSCYIMKDISPEDAEEASYVFAEDEEAEAVMELFSKLLEDEGIRFETEEG